MTADPQSERGSALLGVMLFSGLAATVMAVLVARVVVEHRAVEDSIAQTRAYWAAMGFNNYVLSRTLVSGACKAGPGCGAGTTDYSPQAKTYLNEIADMQSWYYMDIGASYVIQLSSQVCQDKTVSATATGEIVIKTAFSGNGGPAPPAPPCPTSIQVAQGPTGPQPPPCTTPAVDPNTIDALRGMRAARPVEFHYCVVASGVGSCGTGPTAGTTGGPQLITAVHRPAC